MIANFSFLSDTPRRFMKAASWAVNVEFFGSWVACEPER
jgi:hypothetical protein